MKIEGTIDLSTLYPPREHRSDERTDRMGRVVHLFIENGTLRIPRKEWSHPAGSLYSEYTNWMIWIPGGSLDIRVDPSLCLTLGMAPGRVQPPRSPYLLKTSGFSSND